MPGSLRFAAAWESAECAGFARRVRELPRLPQESGLPGRIWKSKAPGWITNLGLMTNFPRLQIAREHGLDSAFAFPSYVAGDVLE